MRQVGSFVKSQRMSWRNQFFELISYVISSDECDSERTQDSVMSRRKGQRNIRPKNTQEKKCVQVSGRKRKRKVSG